MKHKTLFGLLNKRYELISIDYGSSLDGDERIIQDAIHANDWMPLDEQLWEWEMDCRDEGLECAINELKDELRRYLDARWPNFDIEEFIELHRGDIEDEIYNRDSSTFLDDLIRNTGEMVAFYSTGVTVNDTCFMEKQDWNDTRKEIKQALHLKGKEYDKVIDELMSNAPYGGELVIYFNLDSSLTLNDLIGVDVNTITFKYPHIAIINTCNGSGHNVELANHVFSLPFERENFYLDKTIKYSYTYEVCGMYPTWCDSTVVKLSKTKLRSRLGHSYIGNRQREDDELSAKFRSGKCTYGDMDRQRHKRNDLVYVNDFPCGTHCKSCGTFWID